MAGSPTAKKYLTREHLAELVRAYRESGGHSSRANQLGEALAQIAGGVWDRYRFTPDREDFTQEIVLHLLGSPLNKADLSLHLFNYFTTCAIRHGNKLRNKANAESRRFNDYAQDLADSGRALPTVGEDGELEAVDENGGEWVVFDTDVAEFAGDQQDVPGSRVRVSYISGPTHTEELECPIQSNPKARGSRSSAKRSRSPRRSRSRT